MEMESVSRVQILDKAVSVSFRTNDVGERHEFDYTFSDGKIVGQIGFFSLGWAIGLEEGEFQIQTSFIPLKYWPCDTSYLWCKRLSKYIWTHRRVCFGTFAVTVTQYVSIWALHRFFMHSFKWPCVKSGQLGAQIKYQDWSFQIFLIIKR